MRMSEARAWARQHRGIRVEIRPPGTWRFRAEFHSTDGKYFRNAGQDPELALQARQELVAKHSKPKIREPSTMTEQQARDWACQQTGIRVIRSSKTFWCFEASFHTTNKHYVRYAGCDMQRALALRTELIAKYKKGTFYYPD